MTDNEIIKALECCGNNPTENKCKECPFNDGRGFICIYDSSRLALDLINRQKAEIERLQTEKENLIRTYAECQVEVVKEFAERLKEYAFRDLDGFYTVMTNQIDNLLKERAGDAE